MGHRGLRVLIRRIIALGAVAAACVMILGGHATSAPPNRVDLGNQWKVSDTDPTWSRRDQIAFLRRSSSDVSIVLRRPAGPELTLVKLPQAETFSLSFSPDGTRLAVIANFQLYVVTVATGAVGRLGPAHEYDWGPDSQRVVTNPYFEVTDPMRIVRVSDGRIIRKLVRGSSPDWSGRAGAIAFSRARPDDLSNLYRISPRGGRPELLARTAGLASWSPNGQRLAFVRSGWTWVMDIRSKVRRRIASSGGFSSIARWSPAGSHLLLWDQGKRINVVTRTGQTVLRLSGSRPAWSASGRRIVFASAVQCEHPGIWLAAFPRGPRARITGRC